MVFLLKFVTFWEWKENQVAFTIDICTKIKAPTGKHDRISILATLIKMEKPMKQRN